MGYFEEMQGELAIIREIRRKSLIKNKFLRVGIGDDAAVLRPSAGSEVVVTTDFSLEGRHFADWHPPRSVGHRCLARGLSDLAAMGARPMAAFLSIGVTESWLTGGRLKGFTAGLLDLARTFEVPLAGGDTAAAPGDKLVADIVLLGEIHAGKALLRSGAKPGDAIYVSGALGGAAAELERLMADPSPAKSARPSGDHPHLFPRPRIAVGLKLASIASACMDVSDGLSSDLAHICEESGVGAEIEADRLPIHQGATLEQALHGGEDYELLFTAPATKRIPRSIAGVPLTRIGSIVKGEGLRLLVDGRSKRLKPAGWQHLVR